MKLQSRLFRSSLLLSSAALLLGVPRASAQNKKGEAAASDAKAESVAKPRRPIRDDKNLEKIQEGSDFLRRRQEWFFKPRAFPIGFIPQGARERALQQKMQMLESEGRLNLLVSPAIGLTTPGPTTSGWQAIGPQATSSLSSAPFTSGRVTALAVNPGNASNAYAGAADGGLWITTDGGTIWTPLTDFQTTAGVASIAVGALALDPSACTSGTSGICTTVYVATGEGNFNGDGIYGNGVLKCTITTGTPPKAACTQDSTFHTPSPLDETRGGPSIGALAINRKTAGSTAVLLAGVRGRGTALQSGIYCSANGGSTWAPVFGISGIVGTDAVFASDGTAFVAIGTPSALNGANANNGIYKSNVPVSSCAAVTDSSGTTPGGMGSKWAKQTLPAGTPAASLGRIALAIAPSATSNATNATIYAAIEDSTTAASNLLGVIKTTNGGGTWTQLTGAPAFCNSQCFYDLALAVFPTDANTVFAAGSASSTVGGSGVTIARSTDGGTTWTDISRVESTDGTHVDVHALGLDSTGSTLYAGTDGGVWKTTSPKGTVAAGFWSNLNQSFDITQFYPGISIHPSTPLSGLGGTQDNDIQQYQGPSLVWVSQEIGCDGGFTAIDPQIPSTIYGECFYEPGIPNFPIIAVAFDGGQGLLANTGFLVNAGIDNTDRGSFIPPLVMDPSNHQTLYFGTCRVWQTTDGAFTWNAISPDVTDPTHPVGCSTTSSSAGNLTTVGVAPAKSNVIYVGSDDGDVEVTSNGGTTWTSIATATLPGRSVTQIAVDPSSATGDIAYVAFSGFGSCATFCDGLGHVFKTVNGTGGAATTWTNIDGTVAGSKLPDIPVNAIVIDPDDTTHNTLYVGTDIGAFFTTNGGTTWSALGTANSLPSAEILGMALHEPSRTLRAATHGRGVWDLNLGGQSTFGITSISPFTANAGASATTLTVNGNGFLSTSSIKFTINGASTTLTPTSSTATQLTALIPAANLVSGGAAQVSAVNGAVSSSSLVFTVLNPLPGITSISPTTATTGTNGLALTVNGGSPSNFFCGTNQTLVLLNFVPLSASAITACNAAAGTLTVQIPASNLATAGTITVDTFNPQPGGGPDPNPTPPTLTVSKMATMTVLTSSSTNIPSGGSVTLTATVTGSGTGASPSGTVQFMNGSTALGTAQTCAAVSGAAMPTCKATLTTTLAFLVPPIAPRRAPPGLRVQPIGLIVAVVLLLLSILGLQRIPPRCRRVYACVAFLLLTGVIVGFVGCGGGYGGGGGPGLHYDSITAVYSGDATYSGSTSTSVQITIQ